MANVESATSIEELPMLAVPYVAGLSQRDSADRLGVNKTAVPRDENFDYRRIGIDRSQRISK